MSIADRLASLRAAKAVPEQIEEEQDDNDQNRYYDWYVYREVYRCHLELAGRKDIDYLMTRPSDEWSAILKRIETNPKCNMRFSNDN